GNAGVWVFHPDGKKLAVIPTPEDPTNCVFGGPDRTTLYVTAGKSLYRISLGVEGFAVYWPSSVAVPSRNARDGWTTFAVRDEIAPRSWQTPDGDLALAGRGDEAVDGRWQRTVSVTAGRYYTFRADYRAKQVATPERSALARVVWLDAGGKQVAQPEYPVTSPHPATNGATVLTGTYQAPEKSTQARLELHLRWAPQGEVVWHNPRLEETAPPAPRKV